MLYSDKISDFHFIFSFSYQKEVLKTWLCKDSEQLDNTGNMSIFC